MNEPIPGEFYISDEIIDQAQREGAECLRSLYGLMDEIGCINSSTKTIPYIRRFDSIYEKITVRIMIILTGISDTNNGNDLYVLYNTYKKFEKNQKYLHSMVKRLDNSDKITVLRITFSVDRWMRDICSLANEVNTCLLLGSDNKIYPSLELRLRYLLTIRELHKR